MRYYEIIMMSYISHDPQSDALSHHNFNNPIIPILILKTLPGHFMTCVCVCLCSGDSVCIHVSVHVQVYVCSVPNIKFVSLAYMPNEPKSAKCDKGICVHVCLYTSICLCVSVAVSVCVCGFVCGVKYKISIFGMYVK